MKRRAGSRAWAYGALAATALLNALAFAPAAAFVNIDFSTDMAAAPRWSAGNHPEVNGKGLQGGIEVAVEPDFAEVLTMAVTGGALPEDVAAVEAATLAAFRAWESSVLTFAVTFDGPAVRGETLGAEIDLFAVPESDPVFASNPYFGVAHLQWVMLANRQLTNGAVGAGNVIRGADVYLNVDMLTLFAPLLTREQQLAALTRLIMHEVGHALGLHHPHDGPSVNFDTDADPYNAMLIDPADPFADLILSPNINQDVVMSRQPSDLDTLLFTALTRDDRGGRDVLYPAPGDVPEICTPMPASCRTALKSVLQLRDDPAEKKDRIVWKWLKGAATDVADFGDPTAATHYAVCLYAGTTPAVLGELTVFPDAARWSSLTTGFRYKDDGAAPHGVKKVILKAGPQDTASLLVKGAHANVPDGLLPLGRAPVVAQLQRADIATCWTSTFETGSVLTDTAEQYKARVR